jgi:hypothetical protein
MLSPLAAAELRLWHLLSSVGSCRVRALLSCCVLYLGRWPSSPSFAPCLRRRRATRDFELNTRRGDSELAAPSASKQPVGDGSSASDLQWPGPAPSPLAAQPGSLSPCQDRLPTRIAGLAGSAGPSCASLATRKLPQLAGRARPASTGTRQLPACAPSPCCGLRPYVIRSESLLQSESRLP